MVYPNWISSQSDIFKIHKRNDFLVRIVESGLIQYLADTCLPTTMVLFGSTARGEDVEDSDVDLMLVAREKTLDIQKFEKQLHRKIALHFEPDVAKIPKELLNNVINGIVVYGYFKVF